MKQVLNDLLTVAKWFFADIIPQIYNASLGAIGELLDAFGYVRAIIIGIFGALAAILAWIWKRLNR